MTFKEALAKVVTGTPGARGALIIGTDGIPVEEFSPGDESVDLPAVAVEFQGVLEEARKVADTLGSEPSRGLEELVLQTTHDLLVFRALDEEYYLVVAMDRGGLLGKARYLISSLLHEIRQEL
jgi:predicted regulator of Ras-like GTPase activity (Roadblock/LC7/MglB family)